MAIYALARGFAGCEQLITIGAVMAVFPLVHAMLADDLRRTLAHVLNNQLGFMVVAIGIGTPLAMDGAAAQAFAHVIYKGLLFMAMGAVLHRTGTCRQSRVGGLASQMPLTCLFCIVGALSALPLNCSFVTKALILDAVAEHHLDTVWLVLLIGAVGAFLAAGIKVPYFAFFRGSPSHDVQEAPANMLVAMGLSAGLCVVIGIWPGLLYQLLPHSTDAHPYTVAHVIHQLQLLVLASFVFALFISYRPLNASGVLLDVDWIYRRPIPRGLRSIQGFAASMAEPRKSIFTSTNRLWNCMLKQCSEGGMLGRSVSSNAMAFFVILLLAIYLIFD
jgi:multicomponent Na+:H+ antiporter subunit D